MRLHSYSSEGIVLGRRNLGEADKVISIYSKDHGRISVIAKGVRRPKSRKRGHLEIFNHLKFQLVDGKGLGLITEADMINDFSEIRKSLNKVSLAYYFMEVIGRITHEDEPIPEVFELLLSTLEKLSMTNNLKKLRMDFILKLLIILGYWPHGEELLNPDNILEEVIERKISSQRVGKIMLQ